MRVIVRDIVLHDVLLASAPAPAFTTMSEEHNGETIRLFLEFIFDPGFITERFDLFQAGGEGLHVLGIEIPDAIKELEYRDFRFDVPQNGPITFKIFFAPGTLPETWPEARQRKTRTPKHTEATSDSTGEAMAEDTAQDAAEMPQDAIEPQAEEMPQDATEDAGNAPDAASGNEAENEPLPETMTVHYNVEGSARKALAHAIGEHIGKYPAYQAAPTFAYTIGEYTLDRHGILIGPHSDYLLGCLAEDGYETK